MSDQENNTELGAAHKVQRQSCRWSAILTAFFIIGLALTIYALFHVAANLRSRLDNTRLNPLGLGADSLLLGGEMRFAPVALIGDSRAEMWREFPQVAGHWRNFGVSGHTTGQVLARFAVEVKPTKPGIIVIIAGVNDLGIAGDSAQHRQEIEQDAERNLGRLVRLARDDGAAIIVATIVGIGDLPLRRRLDWPGDFEANRARLNRFIRNLAAPGVLVLDAEAILQHGPHPDVEAMADFIHFNSVGYARLNRELEPLLRTLVSLPPK
jgi:lysophospholipase L1-like esterase